MYKYKSGTEELQGICFKIKEYKYKGSEIDRNFSLKNLQRTIEQNNKLQLNPILISFANNKQSLQTSYDASIKERPNEKFFVRAINET